MYEGECSKTYVPLLNEVFRLLQNPFVKLSQTFGHYNKGIAQRSFNALGRSLAFKGID